MRSCSVNILIGKHLHWCSKHRSIDLVQDVFLSMIEPEAATQNWWIRTTIRSRPVRDLSAEVLAVFVSIVEKY